MSRSWPGSHPPAPQALTGLLFALPVPQPVLIMGFALAQVQNLALGFVKLHEIPLGSQCPDQDTRLASEIPLLLFRRSGMKD